jgi:hypothetical protein
MVGKNCKHCKKLKVGNGKVITRNSLQNLTFHARGMICKFKDKCNNPLCRYSHETVRGTSPSNPLSRYPIPKYISKDACFISFKGNGRRLNENDLRYISLILKCDEDSKDFYVEFTRSPSHENILDLKSRNYIGIIYRYGKNMMAITDDFMKNINFLIGVRNNPPLKINPPKTSNELNILFHKEITGLMIPKNNLVIHGFLAALIFQFIQLNTSLDKNNGKETIATIDITYNGINDFIKIKNKLLLLKVIYLYNNCKFEIVTSKLEDDYYDSDSDSDSYYDSESDSIYDSECDYYSEYEPESDIYCNLSSKTTFIPI